LWVRWLHASRPFPSPHRAGIPSAARKLPAHSRPVCTRRAIPVQREVCNGATRVMARSVRGRLCARRFLRSARSFLARVGRNDGRGRTALGVRWLHASRPFPSPHRAVIPSVARNLPAHSRPVCTRRAIPIRREVCSSAKRAGAAVCEEIPPLRALVPRARRPE
jgi:hypothetical protein